MGFSSASTPQGGAPGSKIDMSFGDKLLNAFGQTNPIANALGGAIFGQHKLGTYNQGDPGVTGVPITSSTPTAAPINLPQVDMPNFSDMISQNAQPKKGGLGQMVMAALGL